MFHIGTSQAVRAAHLRIQFFVAGFADVVEECRGSSAMRRTSEKTEFGMDCFPVHRCSTGTKGGATLVQMAKSTGKRDAKETDRIKVSNFIAGAIHSSGSRGTRFDAQTAVTWKFNFRHPPKDDRGFPVPLGKHVVDLVHKRRENTGRCVVVHLKLGSVIAEFSALPNCRLGPAIVIFPHGTPEGCDKR